MVRQDSASTGGTVGGGGAPTASIFLQTGSYLLDVHALKVSRAIVLVVFGVVLYSWCLYNVSAKMCSCTIY